MAWASQEGQAFIPQENEELDEGAGDGLGEGGTPGQNHRAELMDILMKGTVGSYNKVSCVLRIMLQPLAPTKQMTLHVTRHKSNHSTSSNTWVG